VQKNMNNICASYQKAAVEVLVKKTAEAAMQNNVKSVGVVGGVAANSLLRKLLSDEICGVGKEFYVPEFQFCTDNAAMIARAGLERLKNNICSRPDLNAYPALRLGESG
jgi:N6-L-threonylcarbamoyladenine synthase